MNQASFEIIETILYHPPLGLCRLNLHLKRLEKTAHFYAYPCDLTKVKNQLNQATSSLNNLAKIRLSLHASGVCQIQVIAHHPSKQYKVSLYPNRINTQHVDFRYKTTASISRGLYQKVFAEFVQANGIFDAIFTNQDGFITEGTRCNIYLKRQGQFYTPPLGDGLIPGVIRSEKIKQRCFHEKQITIDDLDSADELWISNAMIGLIQAHLAKCDAPNTAINA